MGYLKYLVRNFIKRVKDNYLLWLAIIGPIAGVVIIGGLAWAVWIGISWLLLPIMMKFNLYPILSAGQGFDVYALSLMLVMLFIIIVVMAIMMFVSAIYTGIRNSYKKYKESK